MNTFQELNEKLGGNEVASDWSKHSNGGGWVHKSAKVDATAYIGDNAIVWGRVYGNARVDGNALVYENAQVSGDAQVYGNARVAENAWVFGDARVDGNARVYGNARVSGDAWVYEDARVCGDAWVAENALVYGNAWVYGNALVYGNAWVYGNARVDGNALVYGNAWVYGNARVSGDARVCGDAWETSPLFIVGSKHSLTNARKGHIQIGCKCAPFKWWLSKDGLAFAKDSGYTAAQIKEYRAYVKLFMAVGK